MTSGLKVFEAKATARVFSDYLAAQRGRIPPLPEAADLTDRVIRILGGNPGEMQLQGTNTYLVGMGKSRILIDTGQGFPTWISSLTKCLQNRNLEISHVLLTHWHSDHSGGVADLIAHDPSLSSRIYKNQPDRGQLPITDGQTFQAEGATIRAVFTPGHAVDHMCFVLEQEQALFTGDNVLGHGFTVIEDLGAYLNSLQYMGDQQCAVGYPGHGAKIEGLAARMKLYVRREEVRLSQVYEILAERGLAARGRHGLHHNNERRLSFTGRELVTFLYGEVSDSLFDMALEPCMNRCLWKLAEDGKVGFELVGSKRLWYARVRMNARLGQ